MHQTVYLLRGLQLHDGLDVLHDRFERVAHLMLKASAEPSLNAPHWPDVMLARAPLASGESHSVGEAGRIPP